MVRSHAIVLMSAVLFFSATASAQEPSPPDHPSPDQMIAVRSCAAKQGVDLAPPPRAPEGPPAGGMPPAGMPSGPPGASQGPSSGPPPNMGHAEGPPGVPSHLTDDQKNIVDACFQAQGLEPPAHHGDPHPGDGDRLGPPNFN